LVSGEYFITLGLIPSPVPISKYYMTYVLIRDTEIYLIATAPNRSLFHNADDGA
jgi:hypothetical protein